MYVQDFGDSPDARRPTLSIEDKHAVMLMTNSLKCMGNRYEVGLPRRSNDIILPYNRSLAEKQLSYLNRKLIKDPDLLTNYNRKIDDYIENGYATKGKENELPATPIVLHHVPAK